MTIEVAPDDDREAIAEKAGASVDREDVRTSEARERRLQKNVRRQARDWDTTVNIDTEFPTAKVKSDPNEAPEVVITGTPPEQSATDMDGQAWDWTAQRGFGVHEVGHIRYSDMEDADARRKQLPTGAQGTAHSLWNAAEDGAIEKQVVNRWPNFYSVLRNLRANVFANSNPGIPDPEQGGYVFPIAHAAQSAVMDLWMREVYRLNTGVLDGLKSASDLEYHFATGNDRDLFLDEVLPECEALVDAALNTPNAVMRNELMFVSIENIIDLLDKADADGQSQKNGEKGDGDDGSGMPDDSRDNHSGGADSNAEQLKPGKDAEDSEREEDAAAGAQPDDADLDDIEDVEVEEVDASQAREQANDDARAVAGVTGDLLDEIEDMQDALGDAGADGLRHDSIQLPGDDNSMDRSRFEDARGSSAQLAQLLRQRLQHERRTKVQRDKRRGRLDSSRLHRTATGNRNVKKRIQEPEEKDYTAVVLLDRSGSMGRGRINPAESAAGMLLMALETVGVETMLLSLYNSEVVLEKPFGLATEDEADNVFHGGSGGGTPLTDSLAIARERLNQEGGNRFAFVVTDGEPAKPGKFGKALGKCTFPVVGVTVNEGGGSVTGGHYHRNVKADPKADLQQALTNLVQEVMF